MSMYINTYVQYEYKIILSNFRTTKGGQSILLTRLLFPRNEWVDRHTQVPQNTYTSLDRPVILWIYINW